MVIGDLRPGVGVEGQIVLANDANQRPAIPTRGNENGSVLTHPLPAQDHSRVRDVKAPEDLVTPPE
jgi:hypothetical protein